MSNHDQTTTDPPAGRPARPASDRPRRRIRRHPVTGRASSPLYDLEPELKR